MVLPWARFLWELISKVCLVLIFVTLWTIWGPRNQSDAVQKHPRWHSLGAGFSQEALRRSPGRKAVSSAHPQQQASETSAGVGVRFRGGPDMEKPGAKEPTGPLSWQLTILSWALLRAKQCAENLARMSLFIPQKTLWGDYCECSHYTGEET